MVSFKRMQIHISASPPVSLPGVRLTLTSLPLRQAARSRRWQMHLFDKGLVVFFFFGRGEMVCAKQLRVAAPRSYYRC